MRGWQVTLALSALLIGCSGGSGGASTSGGSSLNPGWMASSTASFSSSSGTVGTTGTTGTSGTTGGTSESTGTVDPIGGVWTVDAITCAGQTANADVKALINPPDGITFTFVGDTLTESASFEGCSQVSHWDATFMTGAVSLAPAGFTCTPSTCATDCGMVATAESYSFSVAQTALTLSLQAGTFDTTCTSHGMGNPVAYTLGKPVGPPP